MATAVPTARAALSVAAAACEIEESQPRFVRPSSQATAAGPGQARLRRGHHDHQLLRRALMLLPYFVLLYTVCSAGAAPFLHTSKQMNKSKLYATTSN